MLRGDWSGFFQSQSEAMKKFNKPTKEGRRLVTETEEVLPAIGRVSTLTEPWTGHGVAGEGRGQYTHINIVDKGD